MMAAPVSLGYGRVCSAFDVLHAAANARAGTRQGEIKNRLIDRRLADYIAGQYRHGMSHSARLDYRWRPGLPIIIEPRIAPAPAPRATPEPPRARPERAAPALSRLEPSAPKLHADTLISNRSVAALLPILEARTHDPIFDEEGLFDDFCWPRSRASNKERQTI